MWPGVSRLLAIGVLLISIILGITFSVQKNVRAHRKGQLDRPALVRNLVVEISGMVLTFLVVLFIAGRAAQAVGLAAGSAAESHWPGMGMLVGILSGLLVGMLVGIGIALLVQMTWGRLVKRPRAVAVEDRA